MDCSLRCVSFLSLLRIDELNMTNILAVDSTPGILFVT